MSSLRCTYSGGGDYHYFKGGEALNVHSLYVHGLIHIEISAVVRRLFRKPVNLFQKTVGYRLTFIQSSGLYFLSIHAILLELDHQCVHMSCNVYVVMKQIHSFATCRNIALSCSEWLMIIKSRGFYVLGHISNIFLLHYEPKRLRNWKRFWLETVGYR